MGTKNQRAVYEWVNISDDLVYEWVHFFFKDQVYKWGRLRNTGSNTRTTITPKLPAPPLPLPKVSQRRKVNALTWNKAKFSFYKL